MKHVCRMLFAVMLTLAVAVPAMAGSGPEANGGGNTGGESTEKRHRGGEQEMAQVRQREQEQERVQEPEQDGARETHQYRSRGDHQGDEFEVLGTVTAVDPVKGTIWVRATRVKAAERTQGAEQVKLQFQARTLIQRRDGSAWVMAAIDQLQVGQSIVVRGTIGDSAWTAIRLRVTSDF